MVMSTELAPPGFRAHRFRKIGAPLAPASTSKILVVEDSASARRLLQAIFVELGVDRTNLQLVATEEAAREAFARWKPDVVFIDLYLHPPGETPTGRTLRWSASHEAPPMGADLAKEFYESNPSVKIVICSASDPAESLVGDFVRSGRFQGVLKPIWASKIQDALARADAQGPSPALGGLSMH
jgi:CheY-like chemotaxis protein